MNLAKSCQKSGGKKATDQSLKKEVGRKGSDMLNPA